jgi:uncharacterized protein (TIGR00369 family)
MNTTYQEIESAARQAFEQEAFIFDLGIEVIERCHGQSETVLQVQPRHMGRDLCVHTGVLSIVAEHAANIAGQTVVDQGEFVRTVELKANLLRHARGNKLRCKAQVLRQGAMLLGVGAEVFTASPDEKTEETLVARALVTLSIVEKPRVRKEA